MRWSRRPLAALVLTYCTAALAAGPARARAATFVVDSTACTPDANAEAFEPANGACATTGGKCTLHAAVFECAAAGSGCVIQFTIPTVPTDVPGVCAPAALPTATYDGTTQASGFVRIDPTIESFSIAGGSVLRGLHLPNVRLGDGSLVEGCRFIGGGGLTIGSSTTVGGTTLAARNEFVGGHDCITVEGNDNLIQGNFIGLGLDGDGADHNCWAGVWVRKPAARNRIGGVVPGARNVIVNRGGPTYGVVTIDPGTSGTIVEGNYIGTDPTGLLIRATGAASGVWAGGVGTRIGGPSAAARNVIVGPGAVAIGAAGIMIDGGTTGSDADTSNVVVQGNWIGIDASGANGLGHFSDGIHLTRMAHGVTIGGTTPGAGNVIAGNTVTGIYLDGRVGNSGALGTCHDNLIQGNLLGTTALGTAIVGNAIGIRVKACWDNLIGGTETGAANVIAGNAPAPSYGVGIQIYDDAATGNVVQGNWIGLGTDGAALANAWDGIDILAPQTTVGGPAANAGNVVGNSGGCGIRLRGNEIVAQGNLVGVGPDGETAAGNQWGLCVQGFGNLVGGSEAADANVIANSSKQGIIVTGVSADNALLRNELAANHMGIDLGNDGITSNDSLDVDDGANHLQNAPVLTAIEVATGVTVYGSLHSAPETTFRLDFYASCSLDAVDQAEAEHWLGTQSIETGSLGDFLFTAFLPLHECPLVTATATDPDGNTSELSLWVSPPTTVPSTSTTSSTSTSTSSTTTSTSTTLPCRTPRCLLEDARTGEDCAGTPLPHAVTTGIARALVKVDAAALTTPGKARRLRRTARTLLAKTGRAAMRASSGKHPKLTRSCASTLRQACTLAAEGLRTP